VTETVLFYLLAAVALAGALTVVLARDVTRLGLGLGSVLLAIAGLFALFGYGFLALAQLFVYVGGVLVLTLFAIMLVHRSDSGGPRLSANHDPLAAIACVGLVSLGVMALRPVFDGILPAVGQALSAGGSAPGLGEVLLGEVLVPFELVGGLLLVALVTVVSLSGGRDR